MTSALPDAPAATAQIKKVLPHYLDKEGRHTLAPSLYERDAYQAHLRRNPGERSALRFDVNWKAPGINKPNLKLRLELRSNKGALGKPLVLETPVKPPILFSKWSALKLEGDAYASIGEIIAWRATLWDGESMLAELKSFLW
ncbi:MAG: hypothetical protein L0Z50_11710 [Verrucomicrobiales bacterium]|nr:hypothetical protein [Verrucomicrobiales bacterium]